MLEIDQIRCSCTTNLVSKNNLDSDLYVQVKITAIYFKLKMVEMKVCVLLSPKLSCSIFEYCTCCSSQLCKTILHIQDRMQTELVSLLFVHLVFVEIGLESAVDVLGGWPEAADAPNCRHVRDCDLPCSSRDHVTTYQGDVNGSFFWHGSPNVDALCIYRGGHRSAGWKVAFLIAPYCIKMRPIPVWHSPCPHSL